ncbi:tRNA lysidine(34) synthetase TilS [Ferrovum sp. PN-J185]|uniref:tRNA lysidine(34) synthetase TilS n=1 Tax=Ferrovum sp. PN-J185 TaxID=1356306 RepID=UPI00079A6066|nr:tRNA lysidine(34) synthetase TilS [Ferrovum sp. PN-J185]KXW55702.1 tRNA(Ile)-lysidine synthase [Ferrovum sp. PN-J185]
MANSRKSAVNLIDQVGQFLQKYITDHNSHITVAVSGGLDSVVLLYLCSQLTDQLQFRLSAVHINHQLQSINDEMQQHVIKLCEKLSIPLTVVAVNVELDSGLGLEKSARQARYNVYKTLDTDFLLLAHHANDQAETFLIQLFRGSGLPGLAAMPESRLLKPTTIQLLRPLIHVKRSVLYDYALTRQLTWVEDPTNQDSYYARNYIRQVLAPLIGNKFSHWVDTLNRTSLHLAKSQQLLDTLALIDLQQCTLDNRLDGRKVVALGEERAANLVRYWLVKTNLPVLQEAQWQSWWQQVKTRKQDTHPRLDFAGVSLVSDNNYWYIINNIAPWQTITVSTWQLNDIEIPYVGVLTSQRVLGKGVKETSLNQCVTLKRREGGESLKVHSQRPHKEIKQLFQELHIPLWQRDRWPFISDEKGLIAIPGVATELVHQAGPDEWGIVLIWRFYYINGQGDALHVKI